MRHLGPYTLSKCLGAGGMGEVWLARRTSRNGDKTMAVKTVALKLLARHLSEKKEYRKLFLKEARLSMLLNNSNIVQVFDVDVVDGKCFMVMEWVDGVNLAQLQETLWQAGHTISMDVAMYIVGEVLRALDYAHNLVHGEAATIVHRDISPANIMISRAGEVKLTDFGVARFGTEETSNLNIKGKPRYMPADQMDGHSKTGIVDLYAVGAVLHEMLDGTKFRGAETSVPELFRMALSGVTPELSRPNQVPEQLDLLRRLLLEPDAGRRVQSARTALEMLYRCPGYRNAGIDLGGLVQWHCAHEASGPAEEGRPFAWLTEDLSRAHDDTSVSRRRRRVSRERRAWFSSPLPISRREQIGAAFLLALSGTCVGCFGIGVAVTNLDTATPSPIVEHALWRTVAQPFSAAQAGEESRPEPALTANSDPAPEEPEPEIVVDPDLDLDLEDQDAERGQPTEQSPLKPSAKPSPKQRKSDNGEVHPPVTVKFVAGTFVFAYVKVGNKQLLIEPAKEMKLTPGRHKIQVRFKPSDKWQYFGKVDIIPGHNYVIELLPPKSVRVTRQK